MWRWMLPLLPAAFLAFSASGQAYKPAPEVARTAAYIDTIIDLLNALRAGVIANDREQQDEIAKLRAELGVAQTALDCWTKTGRACETPKPSAAPGGAKP